jgi:FMNH2-dependent dimethyl sulfone monooxygenase
VNDRCILVNAASSAAGLAYAVRHSDFIFITSPAGADPVKACDALPPHNSKIKAAAKEQGRTIRTIINPHVICRDTEKEAWAQYQAILDHQDPVAADNFHATFAGGDQSSWKQATRDQWVVGGNVHLVGTPEQIVDWFIRLKQAGCDGVQVNFYDFIPDLEYFGCKVVPLMHQAGLRVASKTQAA